MTDPQLPETLTDAGPRLGLRVYGASTLGVRRSALEAAGVPQAMPAVRHIAGEISVGAEYELDDGRVVPLSGQNLATWGASLDDVFETARGRLAGGEIAGIAPSARASISSRTNCSWRRHSSRRNWLPSSPSPAS